MAICEVISMQVEILSVGSELITGTLVDTNSAYIAAQCELIGLEVIRHSCIGDDLDRYVEILLEITKRADIAIITGGLGPTLDDLSRDAAAKAAGLELELYPKALEEVRSYFTKLDRVMQEANM